MIHFVNKTQKKTINMSKKSSLENFLSLTPEQKIKDVEIISRKHPSSIPVVLLPTKDCQMTEIQSVKYLVSGDVSFASFIMSIRKKCSLPAERALFFFINETIPPNYILMKDLYLQYKDEHGYLKFFYCSENCFG